MNVVIFGIHLTINPIAFTIPLGSKHWDIYWYGIIIATGFLLALIYGYLNAERFNVNRDKMLDVIIFTAPISILCARAYYVIFDGEKLTSFGDFFGFGESSGFSGIAIYGAVIGAFGAGALLCKLKKIKILDMFDLAAIGFLIGQGIGRWGNFVNQEAFGTFTGSNWWGMQSERTVSYMGAEGLVHPCFLYESVWCILGVILLHIFSKKRKFSGSVILLYCTWYGLGRGFIELLRTDSLMLGPIKVSSLLSFTLFFASLTAFYIISRKLKMLPDTDYENQFSENEIEEATDETEIIVNSELTEDNTDDEVN